MESSIQKFYDVAPLQIRKNIVRLHCLNPGQTRINGSNSFLIGSGKERILIDCGADRLNNTSMNYVNSVVGYLKENDLVISTILCTHFHDDHIGAIPDLLDAMRKELGIDTNEQVTVSKCRNHHWYEDSIFSKLEGNCKIVDLEDNQVFEVEGAKITSMFTPGHSDDHMCFLLDDTFVGDSPETVIFTGDCVLGTPSGSFDNYTEYMESLNKIREISEGKMICVGHSVDVGEEHIIMEAKTKIDNYIKVRLEREQEIINAISLKPDGSTKTDVYEIVYGPRNLSENLKQSALKSIDLHVDKLIKEGKVIVGGDDTQPYWIINK